MDESEWLVPGPNHDRYTHVGRVGTVPDCWWCRDCGCLVADYQAHDQIPHPIQGVPPR
jgi:hypothetical protein